MKQGKGEREQQPQKQKNIFSTNKNTIHSVEK